MDSVLAHPFAGSLIPAARAYVRYAPASARKEYLWQRYIDPYLAWRDHRFVAGTVAGRIAGRTSDILQQYLYYFGVWEPAVTAFVRRRLQPGDTFADVGANIGYFALLASRWVGPSGRVIAVEASPSVFGALSANLRLNRSPVRALPVAASDRPGKLQLFAGDSGNCGASTTVAGDFAMTPEAEVDAAPLAQLLEADDWARLKLLKIDVEGAEAAVLDGLTPAFDRLPSDCELLIEVHPQMLARAGRSAEELFDRLLLRGYHPYAIDNDYDASAYLWPAPPAPPRRLRGALDWDANVVFSRIDAEEL